MDDVLSHISQFVDEQYIPFASISRSWKHAWGDKPKLSRAIEVGMPVKQLSLALDYGLSKTRYVVSICARMGRIDLLECCKENGFDSYTFFDLASIASSLGDMNLLKWTINNIDSYFNNIYENCALKGNLEMMKWARKKNIPWNLEQVYDFSIIGDNDDLVEWVLTSESMEGDENVDVFVHGF